MIYAILTTSLIRDNYDIRKKEYIDAIKINLEFLNEIPNIKIIIVENNNNTNSFLDDFNCEVIYTDNNWTATSYNKGPIELTDIHHVINIFDIKDDDFIIKITGRYPIQNNSKFINTIKNNDLNNIDCVIRYGSFHEKKGTNKTNDCITGLIGMKCKYIKQIDKNLNGFDDYIECKWAQVANKLDEDRIIILDELGIFIRQVDDIR